MKKVLLFIAFIALVIPSSFSQGLIISEVVEAPSGTYPKYVEITNTTDASIDLNGYKITRYSNGGTSAATAYEFTAEFVLPAKASAVITNMDNTTSGQLWTDFTLIAPTYVIHGATNVNGNGNDVYELVNSTDNAVDVYGVIGTDGTGEVWEYTNSYVYRISTVHNPTISFNIYEWYVAPLNELVGKEADLSPYLTPGTHTLTTSIGTLDLTYPVGGENYETGETVNITWTSTDVANILILVRKSDEHDYFDGVGNSVDATLGTFALDIPTNAEEGNYKIKLVAKEDPTVADSCDFFFIKDVHFAGLDNDPFYPENGAADIPTDLFTGRLEMHFDESVITATGNIYLKKYSDDSVVETFDVNNSSQVSVDPEYPTNILMYISSELDPNTQFYVEVDAGAITDKAGTPNAFDGFTGNSTWSFTTGAGNSYISIYDIQYTTDPSGDSPHNGEVVKTKGIVMAKISDGYYIQEAAGDWAGIYVFDTDNAGVTVGDEVTVAGTVDEHYNVTQLKDILFKTIHSSGNTLYDPVTITLDQIGEAYESVLVMAETISCSNPDLGHGEWEISDGTNTGIVDDLFFAYTPVQDEEFTSITGILNYSYSVYKVEPRDAADIVSVPTRIKNVDNTGLVVSPNPVVNEMRIVSDVPIADVQIINTVGQVMNVEINGTSGQVNVETGGLVRGLYLVKVTFTDGTVRVQKVIKK